MNFCDSQKPRGLYEMKGNISILKTTYFTIQAEGKKVDARGNLNKILQNNEEPSLDIILGFASY